LPVHKMVQPQPCNEQVQQGLHGVHFEGHFNAVPTSAFFLLLNLAAIVANTSCE